MSVTLRTVAERANVSLSTASRALSGSPLISEGTRAVVDQAASDLGYRPNRAASALRSKRSHLIGLVLNNLVNQSFHTIADVIQRRLRSEGYQLILSTTDADPRTEESLLLTLADHGVDGVIIIGSGQSAATTNDFLHRGMAVVNVIRSSHDSLAPTVLAADRDGAYEATEHLASLGHRRIGYIGGIESADSGRARHSGYEDALARHGIPYDESLVLRGPFTQDFGALAATELLARSTGMTALFAANHEAVFGILPVLMQHGMRIPDQLSLVCFEDMPLLQMWHPAVTVIDNGATQLAELSVDLLLSQIRAIVSEGVTPERLRRLTRTYRVGSQLVARASTAPPAPAFAVSSPRKARS
ncbi:LacI family DNA-binding transcriptional regulator [Herbiconiux daphne]|uniref:LacI family transcriptional regulator n=1 Tax=Herbiconiux daphne TaxID=2970914 RepID=A0ABT2H7C0_9MICO|nr:LacI family DNA-binding transcriptional regulator [Herbiconiux daphne]MCS5735813.1 LacI family transcriptional regulator [Herbiconiux daphne]